VSETMCFFFLQYCSFHDTFRSDSLSEPSRHLRNSKFTKRTSNKSGRSIAYNMCSLKKGAANLKGIAWRKMMYVHTQDFKGGIAYLLFVQFPKHRGPFLTSFLLVEFLRW
jgi:hypothetical protein